MSRKYSSEELKTMLPLEEVRKAFMRREDVAILEPSEQEERWKAHAVKVEQFFLDISDVDIFVV